MFGLNTHPSLFEEKTIQTHNLNALLTSNKIGSQEMFGLICLGTAVFCSLELSIFIVGGLEYPVIDIF